MDYLKAVTRLNSEDNLSGIVSIQVARKDYIDFIPEPVDGVIYGDIVFKSGRSWVIWDVILESPRVKTLDNTTREGHSKKNTLDLSIPKDRRDIRRMLTLAEKDEFIVLFRDGNGQQKIFGTLSNPVRFEYNHDSGASFSNLNAYNGRFYYSGPDNTYFYAGALSSPSAGPAPAIVRFNGNVIATLAPGEELDITSDFGFTDFFIV